MIRIWFYEMLISLLKKGKPLPWLDHQAEASQHWQTWFLAFMILLMVMCSSMVNQ